MNPLDAVTLVLIWFAVAVILGYLWSKAAKGRRR